MSSSNARGTRAHVSGWFLLGVAMTALAGCGGGAGDGATEEALVQALPQAVQTGFNASAQGPGTVVQALGADPPPAPTPGLDDASAGEPAAAPASTFEEPAAASRPARDREPARKLKPPPASAPAPTPVGGTFVRPAGAAPLLGMNIGRNKNYDDPAYQQALARLDVAVLAFYPGWKGDVDGRVIRQAVTAMKAINPSLKVGQYTILNEAVADPDRTANDDLIAKLDQMNWWLRDAATGSLTQWTTEYAAYDVNFTAWSMPDGQGERYPQWLARRDFLRFFQPVPEIDLWYFDNVMTHSRVAQADWRMDGVNVASQDPDVAGEYRKGHAAHWSAAATLAPGRLQMGNTDNDLSSPEFRGRLSGAFLEGMMGKSWSLERYGWDTMMQRYFTTTANLKAPAIVGFNVHGAATDYRFFRYAFASCRLGDGHFSYTDSAVGYSSVPWFDEYEVAFGAAIDPPGLAAWSNGVHRRRYEHAMVLVNPHAQARSVRIEPGWRRLLAVQDPATNDGSPVDILTLGPKEGLVLVRR